MANKKNALRPRPVLGSVPELMQNLEPRVLMSTSDFYSVGLLDDRAGSGVSIYVDDSRLDDSTGRVSGTRRFDDSGGLGTDDNPSWSDLFFDDKGGLRPRHISDDLVQEHERGSHFSHRRGFPAGWFLGIGNRARVGQVSFLIEKAANATLADLDGLWAFNGLDVEREIRREEEIEGIYGSMSMASGAFTGTWTERRRGALEDRAFTGSVTSITPSGVVRMTSNLENSLSAYLARDKSVMLWGDFDSGDDEIHFGAAVKRGAQFTNDRVVGSYRVLLVLADEVNDIDLGNTVVAIDMRLQLKADGTYTAFDLASDDTGSSVVKFQGSWTLSNGDEITTTGMLGTVSWVLGANGSTILPTKILDLEGKIRPVAGMGTKVVAGSAATRPAVNVTASVDDSGHHIVFVRGDDDVWRKSDIVSLSGSPAILGKLETWIDSRDGLVYAAGRSASGLILFKRSADGVWSFRNLNSEIAGSASIASNLTVFSDTGGHRHVAGRAANGDVISFRDLDDFLAGDDRLFRSENLTEDHVRSRGLAMPALTGDLVSYVTSWNGLNIGGLDDSGHIHVLWTSPALGGRWELNDLTELTGSLPVRGGLAPYLTSWGGINLAGTDDSGRVRTTWWSPGMDSWRNDDLTENAGGPTLQASTVTTYINTWGGLNVAGLDDSGNVHIYWWAPGRDRWSSSRMSDDSTPDHLRIRDRIRSSTDDSGRPTIVGVNSTGETVALTFEVAMLKWTMVDLSNSSVWF